MYHGRITRARSCAMTHRIPSRKARHEDSWHSRHHRPHYDWPIKQPHRGRASHREHVPPFARGRTSSGGLSSIRKLCPYLSRTRHRQSPCRRPARHGGRRRAHSRFVRNRQTTRPEFHIRAAPERADAPPQHRVHRSHRFHGFSCFHARREHWRRRSGHHAHQRH